MSLTSTTLLLDSSQATGNSANFSVYYNPPIELDPEKQYEIGLISCTCWNAMANVKTGVNDEISFILIRDTQWKTLKIPQGAYNFADLNKTIRELITKAGGIADNFELVPNYNTLRVTITLKNMSVNFLSPRSIAPLIGFEHKSYYFNPNDQATTYNGELPVNITEVNTILVNCSIASGSYSAKGSRGQTIYSFSPEVPPGSIMQINPRQIIYYPINLENQITSITMQLTDQSSRQIDLNNEIVTYYLHLRAIL